MSNEVYPKAREHFMSGHIDMVNDTIKIVAVDTADYTYATTHESLADIPSAARVSTTAAMTGKTITSGVFDADDPTFSAATGDEFEALVVYVDSGTEATSYLLCYIDTANGLPFTPSGADVVFNIAEAGLFQI